MKFKILRGTGHHAGETVDITDEIKEGENININGLHINIESVDLEDDGLVKIISSNYIIVLKKI